LEQFSLKSAQTIKTSKPNDSDTMSVLALKLSIANQRNSKMKKNATEEDSTRVETSKAAAEQRRNSIEDRRQFQQGMPSKATRSDIQPTPDLAKLA
jgi:hypothetical protein